MKTLTKQEAIEAAHAVMEMAYHYTPVLTIEDFENRHSIKIPNPLIEKGEITVSLGLDDVKNAIKGCDPSLGVENDPLAIKAGICFLDSKTVWSNLDRLDLTELWHLYLVCKRVEL